MKNHNPSGGNLRFASLGQRLLSLVVLGVFAYLIARGHKMAEHAEIDARRRDDMFRGYVREAAGTSTSEVDQLEKLASLRADGAISDEEYQRLKAKVMAA